MKRLFEERGSALVMVLFLVLIMTILGTTILSATIGGTQRTATREKDVQSLHLAEKALDEVVAYLTAELAGRDDLDPDELAEIIKRIAEEINARITDGTWNVTTEMNNSEANVEIAYDREIIGDQQQEFLLEVTAVATVNGVTRKLKQEINVDTYPDFLKYALGSEDDLTLNGSPLIDGSIYAGNDLIVTNTAEYVYNPTPEVPTRFRETSFPKVDQEVHIQSLSKLLFSENQFPNRAINHPSVTNISDQLSKIMGTTLNKVKIREKKKFVQIDVKDQFIDKVIEVIGSDSRRSGLKDSLGGLAEWLDTNYSSKFTMLTPVTEVLPPELPSGDSEAELEIYDKELEKYQEYIADMGLLNAKLTDMKNSIVFDGNLKLDGNLLKGLKGKKENGNWLIVDGDLNISNLDEFPMEIVSNILVTGSVYIRDDIEFDSTMFVLGTATVEDAAITGYKGGGVEKELVLISQKKILLNRLDAFSDSTKEVRAFFYTDMDAELYGVGSIFRLSGGFFSKKELRINAVRANVTDNVTDLKFSGDTINGDLRRFEVKYNSGVFAHQQSGLPRVKEVNVRPGKVKFQ